MAEGTKDDPWELVTAPGSSQYTMYKDGDELVCQVGSTTLNIKSERSRTSLLGLKGKPAGCRWVPRTSKRPS